MALNPETTKRLVVSVPHETHAGLQRLAAKDRRSVSGFIRNFLMDLVSRDADQTPSNCSSSIPATK